MNNHEGLRLVGFKSTASFASVSFATLDGRSMGARWFDSTQAFPRTSPGQPRTMP